MVGHVAMDVGDVKDRCRPKRSRYRSGQRPRAERKVDNHGAAPGTHRPGGAVLLVPPAPGRERTVAAHVQVGDGLREVLDPQSRA